MSVPAIVLSPDCHHLLVRPWLDPLVDQTGHDPRGPYFERFWLGVLGPSVSWFLRYVAERFATSPDGFDLDLAACASALGLGRFSGRTAAFPRTLTRCCQFRVARLVNGVTLEVRRKLPPLSPARVAKLPEGLRREHERWGAGLCTPGRTDAAGTLDEQARRLALSLVALGEGPLAVEQQLLRWRFPDEVAQAATVWAFDHRGAVAVANLNGA